MIWDIFIETVIIAYVVYILTIIAHILGIANVTNRKISMSRLLIPFYYWINDAPEKSKKVKKTETDAKNYFND